MVSVFYIYKSSSAFLINFCKYENHQFVKVIFHNPISKEFVKKLFFRVLFFSKNELDLVGIQ